uniref:C-type lectin domain-containing protein n=1 Tax=Anabas testudineus TaxID=64144 RepID=A0A3Q1JI12_ANATE
HPNRSRQMATALVNLTELLQGSQIKLSSLTEERNELKTNLTEMTEERNKLKTNLTQLTAKHNRLLCLFGQSESVRDKAHGVSMMTAKISANSICVTDKTCPDGWTKSCSSCYFLSTESGSWTTGREDCRTRGADLVVIHSAEEQTFISTFTNTRTWIGLNDRDNEGTWKWVDGTLLTVTYWASNNPNNGEGRAEWGEEDCVEIFGGQSSEWNDLSCEASRRWICEKPVQP